MNGNKYHLLNMCFGHVTSINSSEWPYEEVIAIIALLNLRELRVSQGNQFNKGNSTSKLHN